MSYGLLLIVALTLFLIYMSWDSFYSGNLENVKSRVDNNEYLVQSLPDKQEAADLLANIRKNLDKLVYHLEKTEPEDPRTEKIVMNFKSNKISESVESGKYTSYSINKGEKIVFCLRAKNKDKKLVDLNTMMFVALHEISHVGTESVGHTEEFWSNFKWILEQSVDIGIYKKVDYSKNPQDYCGLTVTSNPLTNG